MEFKFSCFRDKQSRSHIIVVFMYITIKITSTFREIKFEEGVKVLPK
jgi:hypothetical protein